MSTTLMLAGGACPSNLHLPPEAQALPIERDMFDICDRIKEIDPSLYVLLTRHGRKQSWVIMESCPDGVQRFVLRAMELDARVLPKLRRMRAIPLDQRLKVIEREEKRWAEQEHERSMDELYERLGRPMWTQLEHDGFIETRGVSYPKLGVAARGRRVR